MRADTRVRTTDGVYYFFSTAHLMPWTTGLEIHRLEGSFKELPQHFVDAFTAALEEYEQQGGEVEGIVRMYQAPTRNLQGYERRGPNTLVRVSKPAPPHPVPPSPPLGGDTTAASVQPAWVPQVPRPPSRPLVAVDVALADLEAEEARLKAEELRLRAQKVRLLESRAELSRQSVPVPTPVATPVVTPVLPPGFGQDAEVSKGVD